MNGTALCKNKNFAQESSAKENDLGNANPANGNCKYSIAKEIIEHKFGNVTPVNGVEWN